MRLVLNKYLPNVPLARQLLRLTALPNLQLDPNKLLSLQKANHVKILIRLLKTSLKITNYQRLLNVQNPPRNIKKFKNPNKRISHIINF